MLTNFFFLLALIVSVDGNPILESTKPFSVTVQQRRPTIKNWQLKWKNGFYSPAYKGDDLQTIVYVGLPAQKFWVGMESGQMDLWLLDSSYPNKGRYQTGYSAANSTTSKQRGSFLGSTGDFQVAGAKISDLVRYDKFDQWRQSFGSITATYGNTVDPEFALEGVLGHAWNPNSNGRQLSDDSPPILHMLSSYKQRVYSIFLERDALKNGIISYGNFNYGSIDQGNCRPDTSYTPLKFLNLYVPLSFDIQQFQFDGYTKQTTRSGQVDTGLAVILAPDTEFNAIYRQLNPDFDEKRGIYTMNCSNQLTQPDMQFKIGNKQYTLPASSYVMDVLLQDGRCALAIGQSNQYTAQWALGNPFNRLYCTIFDVDQNRLGLATAIHNNQNFTPLPV